jgi:hypothetical protein
MKKRYIISYLLVLLALPLFAQQTDTTQTVQKQSPVKKKKSTANKVYYGGNIGLSFGSYFRISVAPLVGYKLSPKASAGLKFVYEYIEDKRYDPKLTASNYGGSVFTRYRLHRQVYAHGEFAYMSYKYKASDIETERQWVPFLFLGGGAVQPISPNAALFVEVLFDVLQDSNSPYENWNPFISIGVAAGF